MIGLILCAGKGSRLKPLTDYIPKCMVEINGKPVLERQLEYLNRQGINKVFINLSPLCHPEIIMNHFGTRLLYLYEPVLLGESGTEAILKKYFDEDLIVMNGDTLTDLKINDIPKLGHEIQSWEKDKYTGIKYIPVGSGFSQRWDFKCWWQDMGTWEGLKKAEEYYAQN